MKRLALFFVCVLLGYGSVRGFPATITIPASDAAFTDTQANALGTSIALSGGDIDDEPTFASLTPATSHTAIAGGPISNLPSGAIYSSNSREVKYTLSGGILRFDTVSGAAYGRIKIFSVIANDYVVVNGVTFTAVSATPNSVQFLVGSDDNATALNLANAINASTDVLIAGKIQARYAVARDNYVWIEAATPGAAGNAFTLTSNGSTLAILNVDGTFHLTGGTDNQTAASPYSYFVKGSPASLPLGDKVRFRFDLSGVSVTPKNGTIARLVVQFNGHTGGTETPHLENFSLAGGQVTSQEYAPVTTDTSEVFVGIEVDNYLGTWMTTNWNVHESSPATYKAAGQFSINVNLSSASDPPLGSPTAGLAGTLKSVGFLTGNGNKAGNLIGLKPGDIIVTNMGDASGIEADAANIITSAKAQGLLVYGYVALGEDADALGVLPYSQATLTIFFNRAKTLGLAGIYFDIPDQGPAWPSGYGVSRYRQVWAVNACHALGLRVIFNAVASVLDNSVNSATTCNKDEGTQHVINDGTAIPFAKGDGISAESFGLRSDGTIQDWQSFQAVGLQMLNAGKNLGIETYGLFYQLPTRTVITQASEESYCYFSSLAYGLSGYTLYSLGGTDDYQRPSSSFVGTGFIDTAPQLSASGQKLSRQTDVGTITISNDPTLATTSDVARTATVFGKQSNITVSSILIAPPQTLTSGAMQWYVSSSTDGQTYSNETALTNPDPNLGLINGFPANLPTFARLRAVLTTSDTSRSPVIPMPFSLSVTYAGSAFARLYGYAQPSSSSGSVGVVAIQHRRLGANAQFVGTTLYVPVNGTDKVKTDSSGLWQIFLPAASGAGTKYEITFKAGGESYAKVVTLVANGEAQF